MNWLYFATSSIVFFAVLNILQRRIAVDSKYLRATTIVFNLFGALLAIALFVILGGYKNFTWPKLSEAWIYMIIAVLFYGLFERGRFKASKLLDASTLSVVAYISLAVAFIGSLLIYNEVLTSQKIFGVILIIFSLALVSLQNNVHKKITLKGILYSVLVFTYLGIAWMLDKKGATFFTANTYSILVWVLPLGVVYFPSVKSKEISYELKRTSWKVGLLAALNVVGYYFQLEALRLGDATRVIPYVQLSTLLTVLFGIFILGEKDHLLQKIVAAVIGLAGAYLLIAS